MTKVAKEDQVSYGNEGEEREEDQSKGRKEDQERDTNNENKRKRKKTKYSQNTNERKNYLLKNFIKKLSNEKIKNAKKRK